MSAIAIDFNSEITQTDCTNNNCDTDTMRIEFREDTKHNHRQTTIKISTQTPKSYNGSGKRTPIKCYHFSELFSSDAPSAKKWLSTFQAMSLEVTALYRLANASYSHCTVPGNIWYEKVWGR